MILMLIAPIVYVGYPDTKEYVSHKAPISGYVVKVADGYNIVPRYSDKDKMRLEAAIERLAVLKKMKAYVVLSELYAAKKEVWEATKEDVFVYVEGEVVSKDTPTYVSKGDLIVKTLKK